MEECDYFENVIFACSQNGQESVTISMNCVTKV
jgi:hypothetical protein